MVTPGTIPKARPAAACSIEDKENADTGAEPARFKCFSNLREELTCAVCLDVCIRPCTTPCGHNYCRSCLRRNLELNLPCPKCRALLPSELELNINTVLWNMIQQLFPTEAAAKPLTPPPAGAGAVRRQAPGRHGAYMAAQPRPPRYPGPGPQAAAFTGTSSRANAAAMRVPLGSIGLASLVGRSVSGPRPDRRPLVSVADAARRGADSSSGAGVPSLAELGVRRAGEAAGVGAARQRARGLPQAAVAEVRAIVSARQQAQRLRSRSAERWAGESNSLLLQAPRSPGVSAARAAPGAGVQGSQAGQGEAGEEGAARHEAQRGASRSSDGRIEQVAAAAAFSDHPSQLLQLLASAPGVDGYVWEDGAPAAPPPLQRGLPGSISAVVERGMVPPAMPAASLSLNPFMRHLRPIHTRAPAQAAGAQPAAAAPAEPGQPGSSAASSTLTASQRAHARCAAVGARAGKPAAGAALFSTAGSSSCAAPDSAYAAHAPRGPPGQHHHYAQFSGEQQHHLNAQAHVHGAAPGHAGALVDGAAPDSTPSNSTFTATATFSSTYRNSASPSVASYQASLVQSPSMDHEYKEGDGAVPTGRDGTHGGSPTLSAVPKQQLQQPAPASVFATFAGCPFVDDGGDINSDSPYGIADVSPAARGRMYGTAALDGASPATPASGIPYGSPYGGFGAAQGAASPSWSQLDTLMARATDLPSVSPVTPLGLRLPPIRVSPRPPVALVGARAAAAEAAASTRAPGSGLRLPAGRLGQLRGSAANSPRSPAGSPMVGLGVRGVGSGAHAEGDEDGAVPSNCDDDTPRGGLGLSYGAGRDGEGCEERSPFDGGLPDDGGDGDAGGEGSAGSSDGGCDRGFDPDSPSHYDGVSNTAATECFFNSPFYDRTMVLDALHELEQRDGARGASARPPARRRPHTSKALFGSSGGLAGLGGMGSHDAGSGRVVDMEAGESGTEGEGGASATGMGGMGAALGGCGSGSGLAADVRGLVPRLLNLSSPEALEAAVAAVRTPPAPFCALATIAVDQVLAADGALPASRSGQALRRALSDGLDVLDLTAESPQVARAQQAAAARPSAVWEEAGEAVPEPPASAAPRGHAAPVTPATGDRCKPIELLEDSEGEASPAAGGSGGTGGRALAARLRSSAAGAAAALSHAVLGLRRPRQGR